MNVVKYVGLAHKRRISAQDWKDAGFEAETVEWSWLNGFSVPVEQFTQEQLEEVIEPDSGFVIVGGDENEVKPRRLPQRMTGQQAADSPRIDMMRAVGAPGTDRGSAAESEASTIPSGSGPTPGGGSAKPSRGTRGTGSGSD